MIEFYLRHAQGGRADTTLISFVGIDAFFDYVRRVGEVRILFDEDESIPILMVPYGL